MEAGKAFGDTGSSNPGICHWDQMSQKPTFWKTATASPRVRKFSQYFAVFNKKLRGYVNYFKKSFCVGIFFLNNVFGLTAKDACTNTEDKQRGTEIQACVWTNYKIDTW